MIEEHRKSCKASPFNTPAASFHPGTSTRRNVPETRRDVPKADKPHIRALSRPLWAFPYEQHQSRIASLIARDYRNRKRHKKILDQKGLTTANRTR
jgi:hypothetical protein